MYKSLKDELNEKYENNLSGNNYKRLINLFYDLINNIPPCSQYSCEFKKKEIVNLLYYKFLDYSKQAFYNLILGNFEMYNASLRVLVENYIILLGITLGKDSVWKKYFLQSGSYAINIFRKEKNIDTKYVEKDLLDLKKEYNLLNMSIEENKFDYSWLSTNTVQIKTFKDACNILDSYAYKDFQFLSIYTHSSSFVFKLCTNKYMVINSVIIHYIYLTKVIDLLKLNTSNKYKKLCNKLWEFLIYLHKNDPFLSE